jgi:TIR domain-containing protein
MDSARKLVFLSYVEEDSAAAHAIAEGLEAKDYSTWLYERDCPTGADYFEETHKAISDCDAMIVLISPRSVTSDQITREIVRAVESSKATLPLLLELSHDEYAKRRPGWKQAMAASNATRVSIDKIPTLIPSLVAGLNAKGIRTASGLSTAHLQAPPAGSPAPDASRVTAQPESGTYVAPQNASGTTTRVNSPGSGVFTPPSTTDPGSGVYNAPSQAQTSTASQTGFASQQAAATAAAASTAPRSTAVRPSSGGMSPALIIGGLVGLAVVGFAAYKFTRPKPEALKPPVAAVTATVVLQYAADKHNCTPDVNVTLAGKAVHPNQTSFAISGLTPGPADYSVVGVVSCPGRTASKVAGSGGIDIKEGAVFAIGWQGRPGNVTGIDIHDASAPPPGDSDEPKHDAVAAPVKTQPTPTPVKQSPPPSPAPNNNAAFGQQALLNSQAALKQGHVFAPSQSSALYWAIQSRAAGNEGGKEMEAQLVRVYSQQVSQFYTAHNYPAAMQLVRELLVYYPNSTGLQQDEQRIQAAMNGAPQQGGPNPGATLHQQLQQLQQMIPQQPGPRH